MNPQFLSNQKVQYFITEFDVNNKAVLPLATDVVTVTSSDSNTATISPDLTPAPDPSGNPTVGSGWIVANSSLASSVPGLILTASVTHADGTSLGPVTDTIDVNVPLDVPTSLGFSLGTPVAQ